jgi:hypothetical protein
MSAVTVCDRHSCLAVRLSNDDAGFVAGALRHAAALYGKDGDNAHAIAREREARGQSGLGFRSLAEQFAAQRNRALSLADAIGEA